MMNFESGGFCLVCGSPTVEIFLDLGETALANKFLSPKDLVKPEKRFPLRVGFCHRCTHVQLIDRVAPDEMFSDYLYVSSASATLKRHFDDLAATLVKRHALESEDLVMDIGCNDATLLKCFKRRGTKTLGIDPAENLAILTIDSGIERFLGYFSADTAGEIVAHWGRPSLITATNTFPHIPDLRGFVEGIDRALAPGGAFVLEAHYLVDLLEQLAFDTVYHEHVSYWSLRPMMRLFEEYDLEVVRAERLPIHHGQLRATIQRQGEGRVDSSVGELLALEEERGIGKAETWRGFAQKVEGIKTSLLACLDDLKGQGKRLAGYGAPAKGSTLLEYFEIGPDRLDFIADRSRLKQGRYTPGTRIPIVGPERLMGPDRPDYVLLLAWNFAEEILGQQAAFREAGGRFIVPVPAVRIV